SIAVRVLVPLQDRLVAAAAARPGGAAGRARAARRARAPRRALAPRRAGAPRRARSPCPRRLVAAHAAAITRAALRRSTSEGDHRERSQKERSRHGVAFLKWDFAAKFFSSSARRARMSEPRDVIPIPDFVARETSAARAPGPRSAAAPVAGPRRGLVDHGQELAPVVEVADEVDLRGVHHQERPLVVSEEELGV